MNDLGIDKPTDRKMMCTSVYVHIMYGCVYIYIYVYHIYIYIYIYTCT